MDEQQPLFSNYPPPPPYPPYAPYPAPQPPRRGGRRLLAAVTATAVVAGVGGVGVGYLVGHGLPGQSPDTTNASGTGRAPVSTDGNGGTTTIPGNGGWSWSDGSGGGSLTLPTNPFSDPYGGQSGSQSGGQGQTSQGSTKAAGSQLTGLVRITTNLKYSGARAAGTGLILTSDGEVVTNHHVVAGATSIKVKVMTTGTTYTAKVVGTDTKDDVAVLDVQGASGLSTVTPDTDGVAVGDEVTAVGDANGTAGYLSAAKGQVMAENQSIHTQSEASVDGEQLTGLLKISSDVISGDSGGATYDADGKVVGMTTAASSGSTDVVGYAVPIAKVLRIADDLENGVTSSRYDYGYPAFLGVGLGQTGTTVKGVYKGTPAADLGLAAGDKITAVDGTSVSSSKQLHNAVAAHTPGDSISVTWTDAQGTSHTATTTLVQGPVG